MPIKSGRISSIAENNGTDPEIGRYLFVKLLILYMGEKPARVFSTLDNQNFQHKSSVSVSAFLFYPLFQITQHILQMFRDGTIRMEWAEKVVFLCACLIVTANICLQRLVLNDHVIFLCEGLQLGNQTGRMSNIDDKHAEKQPNNEGKRKVLRQPLNRV